MFSNNMRNWFIATIARLRWAAQAGAATMSWSPNVTSGGGANCNNGTISGTPIPALLAQRINVGPQRQVAPLRLRFLVLTTLRLSMLRRAAAQLSSMRQIIRQVPLRLISPD